MAQAGLPTWYDYKAAAPERAAAILARWRAVGRRPGPQAKSAAQLFIRAASEIRRRRGEAAA